MTERSFTTTNVVDQTPMEVFDAVNNVRGWWSTDIDGPTDVAGAEFSYHYQDIHRHRFKIVEFVPGETVEWLCVEGYFNFTADPQERTDTRIRFDISPEGEGTRLRFTHVGLTRHHECYDVCANAWGGYVGSSLKTLIATGSGDRNNEVRNAEALQQRH
ncbi:SRPBCC family protein [Micromonospora craniellae]|uniref:SRPBCC domain-containing protein n=1 Tax=Micromonospora craniellae TaxID=2294034 RepID=A0A372FTU1_9ACTN|nr:SRPBCC domain-containing protein [Micromonospora craniellae]QOC93977.1 SRPBCC domain-containing protein [Micromonospora craniellae]RFS44044.1 SRPBCC domain-containing protein [Micromonospora craniellae]